MAAGGGPPTVSDDWRMHLTCSLCLDIFTDPKMVPGCLHTYCLRCLKGLASQHNSTFPCPECRAPVHVPVEGVAAFQANRFLRPQDLAEARNGIKNIGHLHAHKPVQDLTKACNGIKNIGHLQAHNSDQDLSKACNGIKNIGHLQAHDCECSIHPNMTMDMYCKDCDLVLCPRCVLKEHRHHVIKEPHEVDAEAKTQLTEDLRRLQEAVSYMVGELEVEENDRQALQDKKAALETAIHNRYATLVAMADKCRDDILTSLKAKCSQIEKDQSKERQTKQNNLDTLLQLQQQALQAVSSDKPSLLLNAWKVVKDERGSSQNLDTLRTPKRKFVTRPALTFKVSEDFGRKRIEESMQGSVEKVTMEYTSPDVTVKEQFRCGPEKDIEIFSLCPGDNGTVLVSYARKGSDENAPVEGCDRDGKSLIRDESWKGKTSMTSRRNGRFSVISYKDEKWIHTYSKSPAPSRTSLMLSYDTLSKTSCLDEETIVSEDPFKEEAKITFSMSQPGPQRAFDISSTQQLFVVLEDVRVQEKRRVHLYQHDQEKAVATYTPPSSDCQPSDVCFMKLGDQEVLLVSDEAMDSIHVVHVEKDSLAFLRYLATDRPLLVQPTALNVDHEGRLWVACRGGAILTMTPIK